jgi:hypothetical protein
VRRVEYPGEAGVISRHSRSTPPQQTGSSLSQIEVKRLALYNVKRYGEDLFLRRWVASNDDVVGLLGVQPANKAQRLFEPGVKIPARVMIQASLIIDA